MVKINVPFHREGPGRFYRGNLHTHSTNSDGGMTPQAVAAAYKQQGYDFFTLTDHYFKAFGYPISDTTPYRDETFTTLIGAELHAPALANGAHWHILASGLPLDFGGLRDGETGPELAQRAIDAGAFVGFAHPAWYGATIEDLQSIPNAHAVEAYNVVCAALSDRPESWYLVDALLAAGRRVTAFGADDAHFRVTMRSPGDRTNPKDGLNADDLFRRIQATAVDPLATESHEEMPAGFKAWVWVRAERLDPDLLLDALKAGDYYTSQGPQIHDITFNDATSELSIVSSPAVSVFVQGNPAIVTFTARHGAQLTHTTFDVTPYLDSYCRVTVVDRAGLRAWSNPIWFDRA